MLRKLPCICFVSFSLFRTHGLEKISNAAMKLNAGNGRLSPGQPGRCWFHSQLPEMQDQIVFFLLGGSVDFSTCRKRGVAGHRPDHSIDCACIAPSNLDAFNQTFVEAGAADGLSLSNSLFFEAQMGWRGICVEANPSLFRELSKNRPRCSNHHALLGTGSSSSEVFYSFGDGRSFSELESCMHGTAAEQCSDDIAAREFATRMGANLQIHRVPFQRLAELIVVSKFDQIFWMSLDLEGAELNALESFDFATQGASLLTIEGNDDAVRQHLSRHSFLSFPAPPVGKAAGLPEISPLDTWYVNSSYAPKVLDFPWTAALKDTGSLTGWHVAG